MKKYILIIIMINQVLSFENTYTFDGEFTYLEVFKTLSLKTNRSVVGSSECMNLKRIFYIDNQKFFTAVNQIKKSLLTDGYDLQYDSLSFYLHKITLPLDTGKPYYQIYMPYQKKYLVTERRDEYLNAIQLDNEKRISDSLKAIIKKDTIYKIELFIVGFSEKDIKNKGIDFNSEINIALSLFPYKLTQLNLLLKGYLNDSNDKLNFSRQIITYCKKDTMINLVFGSEIRRTNSIISDNNVVKTNYESVYDGLSVKLSPGSYDLQYRILDDKINYSGIPDSISYGSSIFQNSKNSRNFFIFRSLRSNFQKFHIYSKMIATPIIN